MRRYVTAEQRARDEVGVTEDDVMEIRQDISTLRFELIDILHNNGMKTPRLNIQDTTGWYCEIYWFTLYIQYNFIKNLNQREIRIRILIKTP